MPPWIENQKGKIRTNPLNVDAVNLETPLTSFDDLRIAEITPQFQYAFEYTVDNTDLVTNTIVNGGTVIQSEAMAVINSSTTTLSSASMESRAAARYRVGLGGLLRFSGLFSSPVAATEQYIGLMDEVGGSAAFKNGYAIGYDGLSLSVLRWQNDVLFPINQSSWDDPLDGSGASGITIAPEKLNVYQINFNDAGVSFFIKSSLTGKFFKFHTINYTNQNTTPPVFNLNFHFIAWVNNKSTIDDLTVKVHSAAYFTEGKTGYLELHQPQNSTGAITLASVTTELAIVTIRNKATYAGKSNFVDIILEIISTAIEANAANNLGSIRLIRNATLGGAPSYTDINTTNSIVEFDVAGTTVTGGKTLLVSTLAGKNDKLSNNLLPYKIILGPGETITLSGTSVSSASFLGSFLWKELF